MVTLTQEEAQRVEELTYGRSPGRAAVTIGEVWTSEWSRAALDTLVGVRQPLMSSFEELKDAVEAAGGAPYPELARRIGLSIGYAGNIDGHTALLGRIADSLPEEARKTVEPFRDVRARASEKAHKLEQEAADVYANSYGMPAIVTSWLAGTSRQMVDPFNIAANVALAPVGGPLAGRVIPMLARQAAAGAAAQAIVEPVIQPARAELGVEAGFGVALANIAQAGIGAGGLAGLFRGGAAALRYMRAPPAPAPGVVLPADLVVQYGAADTGPAPPRFDVREPLTGRLEAPGAIAAEPRPAPEPGAPSAPSPAPAAAAAPSPQADLFAGPGAIAARARDAPTVRAPVEPAPGAAIGETIDTHATVARATDQRTTPADQAGRPAMPDAPAEPPRSRADQHGPGAPATPAPDRYAEAVELVRGENNASQSFVQRRLGLYHAEARELMARMEREGVVGPANARGRRQVLEEAPLLERGADLEAQPRPDAGPIAEPPGAAGLAPEDLEAAALLAERDQVVNGQAIDDSVDGAIAHDSHVTNAAAAMEAGRPQPPDPPSRPRMDEASAAEIVAMIEREATPEEIAAHPMVEAAIRYQKTLTETTDLPGYGTAEFQRQRVFTVLDKFGQVVRTITGYEEASRYLLDVARGYAEGPVRRERRAIVVLGPPAAGKSGFAEELARRRHAAIVDSDDAKKIIPEFDGGIGANAVHEESDVLGKRVMRALVGQGDNVVIPKVGQKPETIHAIVDALQEAGYSVELVNIEVSPANAYRRMIRRFVRSGRLISQEYFESVGGKPTETYLDLVRSGKIDGEATSIEANGPKGTAFARDGEATQLATDVLAGDGPGRVRGDVAGARDPVGDLEAEGVGPEAGGSIPGGSGPLGTGGLRTGGFEGLTAALGVPPPAARAAIALGEESERLIQTSEGLTEALTAGPVPTGPRGIPFANAGLPGPTPNEPVGAFRFDVTELTIDANRFQFKSEADAEGVTPRLKAVKRWEPQKANQIIVWMSRAGELYVGDGHQRVSLARRLMAQGHAPIEIDGVLYRESDGFSPADVRAIAAAKNLAEGTGTLLDGAKILRDRPSLAPALEELSDRKVQQIAELARLGDEPFRMVNNEVIPAEYGAVVARYIPEDEARQVAAIDLLARVEPANETEARILVQRVAQAAIAKAEEGRQMSMFADDVATTTIVEETKILARAESILRADKAVFRRVVANASRIEEAQAGTIRRNVASEIANDAELFARVLASDAYAHGPIHDKLVALAGEVKSGGRSITDAANELVATLRTEVDGAVPGRLGDRTSGTRGEGTEGRGRGAREPGEPAGRTAAAAGPEVTEPVILDRGEIGQQGLLPGTAEPRVTARLQAEPVVAEAADELALPAGGLFDEAARAQGDLLAQAVVKAEPIGDPTLAREAEQVAARFGPQQEIVLRNEDGSTRTVRADVAMLEAREDNAAGNELFDCLGSDKPAEGGTV